MGLEMFYVNAVTVETWLGTGADGPIYADPVADVPCFADASQRVLRSRDNEEVVSHTTLYLDVAQAAAFVPQSRVTDPAGRVSFVVAANALDGGGLPLPSHLEVSLA